MANPDKMDNLFKSKLGNREFDFDPAAWEKAERLIDKNERRQRGLTRSTLTIAVMLVLAAGTSVFILNKEDGSAELALSKNNGPVNSTVTKNITKQDQIKDIKPQASANAVPVESKESATNNLVVNKTTTNKLLDEELKEAVGEVSNQLSVSHKVNLVNEDNPRSQTAKDNWSPEKSEPSKERSDEKKETVAKITSTKVSESTSNSASNNEASTRNNHSMLSPSISQFKAPDRETKREWRKEMRDKNNMVTEARAIEKERKAEERAMIKLSALSPIGVSTQAREDELFAAAGYEAPSRDRLNWLRRLSFGVIGGIHLSQGFLNNGPSDDPPWVVGPFGGIRVAYHLFEMVSLDVNVMYHMRTGLNSSYNRTIQGANGNEIETTNALSLHYIDIPVYFNYRFGRHGVLLGIQYSHLAGVYNEVVNGVGTAEQWGSTEYFSLSDVGVLAGYEFLMTEQLSLGLRANIGLYDVTDDQQFNVKVKDQNIQIRFNLGYKLFKY